MDAWMVGWVDGWGRWVDGWVDGYMDGCGRWMRLFRAREAKDASTDDTIVQEHGVLAYTDSIHFAHAVSMKKKKEKKEVSVQTLLPVPKLTWNAKLPLLLFAEGVLVQ